MARAKVNQVDRSTIALCMMVRNEEAVIERALESVVPWIDAWSVCDTGSDDATIERVERALGDVRGQVPYEPWVDFGTNRSLAFKHAQALGTDYILVMDADQTLLVHDQQWRSKLGRDGYNIKIQHGHLSYPHPWLLRASKPWRWLGATHEYVHCDEPWTWDNFDGISLIEHYDSSRRRSGAKMREDLALLEAALAENPDDPRTVFYLGQHAQDSGNFKDAVEYYERRVEMGGWPEERFMAQYRTAVIHEHQRDWKLAAVAYLDAYNLAPNRAEPLYRLGRCCLALQRFHSARLFFEAAAVLPKPVGSLFVEDAVYDYAARWGLTMCYRLLGEHALAAAEEDALMDEEATPQSVRDGILDSRATRAVHALPI